MDIRVGLTRMFGGRFGSVVRSWVRSACGRMRIKRRLPEVFDRLPLYVSPAATLEYLLPGNYCFDPELLRVARNYVWENDTVWDVGANLGVFTLAAAQQSEPGRVVAFEADPWLASLVRDSLQLRPNRRYQAGVICGAIGSSTQISSFCVARCGRASSFLKDYEGRAAAGGVEYELDVFTMSLDDLLGQLDPPDFLKIDVEGAEVSVLQGATTLLRDIKPVIYIEVGEPAKVSATEMLLEAGYALFNVASGRAEEIDACSRNTLAVPRSKMERMNKPKASN